MRFPKVFGIGLPRTGTTSLHRALKSLGFPSVHFPFALYESYDASTLEQYVCFVDSPIPLLYKTLDRRFPGSGFILTTRPVDAWLKSMEWLLVEGPKIWPWQPEYDRYHAQFLGTAKFDEMLLRAFYDSFHQDVLDYFQDRDDLLILDLAKPYGYHELCTFLNVDTLPAPYPVGNSARSPRWLQRIARRIGTISPGGETLIRRVDHRLEHIQTHFGIKK